MYGAEFAGGFTGLLEPADTATAGNLSLLFGLVKAESLLGALEVSYPTQESTEVTGPLRGISPDNWNDWADYVGSQGAYGPQIGGAADKKFATQKVSTTLWRATSTAPTWWPAARPTPPRPTRRAAASPAATLALCTAARLRTARLWTPNWFPPCVRRAALPALMETADAVSLGSFDLLKLVDLNLGTLVSAVDVLVPSVKSSGVTGYRKGMTVRATGTDTALEQGFAGGYVGYASGAQIWGDATFADADKDGDRWTTGATHEGAVATGCNVENLRKVSGANCIGGYAGIVTAAGVADVNTNGASSGLLQQLLDTLIGTPSSIASILNATVSTVRGASVSAVDEATDQAALPG